MGEMARITAVLRIELQSDLCSGSGYSYAGIIDSDICYDDFGIPYIPAKRIRGCLRETLESCLYAKSYAGTARDLFGAGGERTISDLVIGNAFPENYDRLKSQIRQKRDAGGDAAVFYDAQSILGRFTHVLAQTRIRQDGTADDNSLRYTRVVNQYSPLESARTNLVFEAEVSCSEEYQEMLEDIAAATRHMGLKRNRGFGNVTCSLQNIRKQEKVEIAEAVPGGSEDPRVIRYRIHNLDPLMLSGTEEAVSRTYISGQSVLGAAAGKYLSQKSGDADTAEFRDLFLNGTVQYSNAYPSDGHTAYFPAPLYINRRKKTKVYMNVIHREEMPPEAGGNADPGDVPKRLKGEYLTWDRDSVAACEVNRDVVYHHSHHKEDGILYSMEVLQPDQIFEGTILLPGKYKALITSLLTGSEYYFGKSRSSQYGRCRVKIVNAGEGTGYPGGESVGRGRHLVVTFLSDALFLSDCGEYTVYYEEVAELVRRELGIRAAQEDTPEYLPSILTTTATGYQGQWNLRRSADPAVAAGSYLVYRLADDFRLEKHFIGERTLEGYGQIRIDCAEDMKVYPAAGAAAAAPEKPGAAPEETGDLTALRNLMMEIILNDWLEQMEYVFLKNHRRRTAMTNAALGRVTLMLKESLDQHRGDPESAYRDFAERVSSIKSREAYKAGRKVLREVGDEKGNLTFARKVLGQSLTAPEEPQRLGVAPQQLERQINARWGDYLMYILTELKYEGGDRG